MLRWSVMKRSMGVTAGYWSCRQKPLRLTIRYGRSGWTGIATYHSRKSFTPKAVRCLKKPSFMTSGGSGKDGTPVRSCSGICWKQARVPSLLLNRLSSIPISLTISLLKLPWDNIHRIGSSDRFIRSVHRMIKWKYGMSQRMWGLLHRPVHLLSYSRHAWRQAGRCRLYPPDSWLPLCHLQWSSSPESLCCIYGRGGILW